jgi:hypothetical protein
MSDVAYREMEHIGRVLSSVMAEQISREIDRGAGERAAMLSHALLGCPWSVEPLAVAQEAPMAGAETG